MTTRACAACLRHSALIGFLGGRLAAVLGGRDHRLGGVLGLSEEELIAAVAGARADEARAFLIEFDPGAARRVLDRLGQGTACRHTGSYPRSLLALADAPPVLYFTGEEDALAQLLAAPVATLVGTRTPSRYALDVAHELGRALAVAGVTVVSGLALGVDAAVHRGALAGGGHPLAVLAGGVDVPYPKTNRALYDRVVQGGAVVSELPPGQAPLRWSFPARNRIMAGLGSLTVVVEATESSGTLITAEFAAQLGRDVGAVPGHVTSRRAAGSNRLLREGAAVIRSAEDALDELFGVGTEERFGRGAGGFTPSPDLSTGDPGRRRPMSRDAEPALDPLERRVLDLVEGGDTVDAIARDAGLSPGRARATLGRLELMGLVARQGFAGYARTLGGTSAVSPMLEGPSCPPARP
ncbi:MAG: DNA-protecting protein DprA [Thermoleophilaceae bacterium]|nr:DNA-protecting protein DprA [Thermoleophilaceae bacterium]